MVIGTDVLVIRGGELLVMNRSVEPSGQCQKCRVSQTDSVKYINISINKHMYINFCVYLK